MKRFVLITAALVLLLGVPSVVGAKEDELKKVTVEWVEEQLAPIREAIDDLITRVTALEQGGGGVEGDFSLPTNWNEVAYTNGNISLTSSEIDTCNWHEKPINVQARAIATYNGVEYYTLGNCQAINFENIPLVVDETVEVKIYLSWMGMRRETEPIAITVTEPNMPPTCELQAEPDSGAAPLTVNFMAIVHDPENDPLTYHWDFGDGNSAENGPEQEHTYEFAEYYWPIVHVSDGVNEEPGSCSGMVQVY